MKRSTPHLVGFGGYARSGKDTAAGLLTARYGHQVVGFGPCVAKVLTLVNPLVEIGPGSIESLATLLDRVGYEAAKQLPEVRRMLQDLGSAVKERDPGFWVRLLLSDIPAHQPTAITGLRAIGEIAAIRAAGGLTIWVHRPGIGPCGSHRNERGVAPDDFDAVLTNDGTVADLAHHLTQALNTCRH